MTQSAPTITFSEFTETFELCLRRKLERLKLVATDSIDKNIVVLAQANHRLLHAALTTSVANTVGIPIPEDRIGDEIYSYCTFVYKHRRTPKDRLMFNDVLYKMKTSDELLDPLRVFVSEKEFVKIYVKAMVGDKHNVPTIGIIRDASSIDSYDFPSSCVIKPTHGSGQAIIRKNGESFDREVIRSWFSLNYYKSSRELNYKNLTPKIIVEPLIFGQSNPPDFKFFCFNGSVKFVYVHFQDGVNHRVITYDREWNEHPFTVNWPKADRKVSRPGNLKEMISTAEALSQHFGLVRIDLYSNGVEHLVGEITNCNQSASAKVYPETAEKMLSDIVFS